MHTRCPQCGKPVEYSTANQWRPFCCERCKLIDLGDWIEERNRIPDEPPEAGEIRDPGQNREFRH